MTEVYESATDDVSPVPVFVKGNLPFADYRITISLANSSIDELWFAGITFTHAIYTAERPTPW
jgi:hypothetical protein